MAGSKKWFTYQADNGLNYAIHNDESKGEAVFSTGGSGLSPIAAGLGSLPRGVQPRYVNAYNAVNPSQRARFKVSTVATYASITGDTIISEASGDGTTAINWRVTSKRGEKARIPVLVDTTLLDGDLD